MGVPACFPGVLWRLPGGPCADPDEHTDADAHADRHINTYGDAYGNHDGNTDNYAYTNGDAKAKLEELPAEGRQEWLKHSTRS